MAKEKAEISTTIANILGDALIPGLFNLVGCVVSFVAYQYFCFTNFCRVTKNKQGNNYEGYFKQVFKHFNFSRYWKFYCGLRQEQSFESYRR